MNIKELRCKIKGLPGNMEVVIRQSNDESDVSMAEDAKISTVRFNEDSDDESDYAEKECFLIKDY